MEKSIIGFAILSLSYAGWFLFLGGCTSWPAATLPLFIVSSTIAVLYGFGLAGILLPGAYCFAILGFVLGLVGVFRSRAYRDAAYSKIREPGPVLFFLLAAILRLVLARTQYLEWDEFSHWGLAAKQMFRENGLATTQTVLHFKDYPPGTALLHYYVTLYSGWSEGATAFAQVLLLLAASVALLQNTSWKQGARIAVAMSLSYLYIVLFNYKPQSLFADHVLGFMFGIAIATCLISEDGKWGAGMRVIPVLLILPLIKTVGLLLALTAAGAIATNHLLGARSPGSGGKWWQSLCLCAALLLAPLITAQSWHGRVNEMGVAKSFKPPHTLAYIRKVFSASASEQEQTILSNFRKALIEKKTARGTPAIVLIVALSLAAFIAVRKETRSRENVQIRAAFLWMFAGWIVYTCGLLLLYLFSFSRYEGLKQASFERYMGVPLLAWSLVTTAFFLRMRPPFTLPYTRYAWIPITLTAGLFLLSGSFNTAKEEKGLLLRKRIQNKTNYAISKTKRNAKIFIVWQASNGFQPIIMAYELAPRRTSIGGKGWSMGKPYNANDVWTVDVTAEDWRKKLMNYDFVLLGKTDEIFWERFGEVFETQDTSGSQFLFKVTARNGNVKLHALAEKEPSGRRF